jgi:hypothetical protein
MVPKVKLNKTGYWVYADLDRSSAKRSRRLSRNAWAEYTSELYVIVIYSCMELGPGGDMINTL